MKYISYILTLVVIFYSCSSDQNMNKPVIEVDNGKDTIKVIEYRTDTIFVEKQPQDEYYIAERLPFWLLETKLLDHMVLLGKYKFDNRFNPLYLEADFNGDTEIDIAIPIEEIHSGKKGIAIIHGSTTEVHIIGAGKKYKNGSGDDINFFDIWLVNRNKINPPGIDETKNLILKNPSIQVEKSEVGGGQLYWNGQEYEYFHQTC